MNIFKSFNIFVFPILVLGFVSWAGVAFAELSPEQEKTLRRELETIEREIQQQQAILSTKKNEGASISRDIAILNAKIKEAQLKIKKHNLAIEKLGKDIVFKGSVIHELEGKITEGKESLAQILRKTNQIEDFTLAEVLLSGTDITEFYTDVESFEDIKESMAETFTELRDAKQAHEVEKEELGKKRNLEIDTKVNVEEEKKKIEANEAEKQRLLSLNKLEQSAYQTIINEKAKKAAAIRAALFPLRDAAAIPFERAYELAKKASKQTGIRPAFLLAIITQESNLGANVGSCVITNLDTGETKGVNTGKLFANGIHPTRDLPILQSLLKGLGRDPFETRVSCPFTIGYGGAMGPAQFIPSTWKLFEARIAKLTGVETPDPWNPEHAFMASAIYLTDLGGVNGSYTGERNAACRYYSGKICGGATNTFYGDQVMAKAGKIAADIAIIEEN